MGSTVSFTSRIACAQRQALERLLFFNKCQDRFAAQIVDAIDKFGPPELVDEGDCLRVRVAGLPDVQSLFAVETDTGRPIAVAIYTRPDLEHVTVLHIGMSEEYCSGGQLADCRLLLRLLKEIRRSSRRLKGVRRVSILYGTPRLRALA